MRPCPVCTGGMQWRKEIFRMEYQIPDGWSLPSKIIWYACNKCNMIYGDGEDYLDLTQAMLDEYYTKYYGYGVSNPDNNQRLRDDADMIAGNIAVMNYHTVRIVDFGGAGDGGRSTLIEQLSTHGITNTFCINPNHDLPVNCHVIYASHVLEHIYDLPQTMKEITEALAPDGLLIVDVPDATGLLQRWRMPILDFNTKHLNHFTLRNLLDLGHRYGFEAVFVKPYELEYAPCFQVHFKRIDIANMSGSHVFEQIKYKMWSLAKIQVPVNIWGMGDIVWHIVTNSMFQLEVLNYIDNDPAYRGQTFKGKPVLERPDNDAPIVILAQGQRQRLIENIRKMGIENEIIEI
jgi:hypothetical protein